MHIYHDSRNINCKTPWGAVPTETTAELSIYSRDAETAVLRLNIDGERVMPIPMAKDGERFSVKIKTPARGMLLWYSFVLTDSEGKEHKYGGPKDGLGGEGAEYEDHPPQFQITVYKPAEVPGWYKDALVYQIFPDRFYRGMDITENLKRSGRSLVDWDKPPAYEKDAEGNVVRWDFYGGTLKGIQQKFNYLKSLGVTAIYLNPIFSATSNHRYDTNNYFEIDPLFGDEESFKEFCAEAKRRSIAVILDGVFNHVGKDSIYFAEGSPYREWFEFEEENPAGYRCWWGVKDLPEVNEDVPSYREYFCGKDGVIRHWLRLGASGWRLDVADELPDSMIRDIRKAVKEENPDALLLGEVWEDASHKISHGERRKYLMGEELDGVMNYPLRSILLDFALGHDAAALSEKKLSSLAENYPPENFYAGLNLLGSHDRPRILRALASTENPKSMLMMLLGLQFALPGVPCIYYGDEAGLTGGPDPENRGSYPWGHEDKELLNHYQEMGKAYHRNPVLKNGSFRTVFTDDDILSFLRENDKDRLLVLGNRSSETKHISFEGINYEVPGLSTTYVFL